MMVRPDRDAGARAPSPDRLDVGVQLGMAMQLSGTDLLRGQTRTRSPYGPNSRGPRDYCHNLWQLIAYLTESEHQTRF